LARTGNDVNDPIPTFVSGHDAIHIMDIVVHNRLVPDRINLRQLTYFRAVVEHGSLAAAAEVLRVAQPNLSVAIKQLESEWGVSLFERAGRGLIVTDTGRALYERAAVAAYPRRRGDRMKRREFIGLIENRTCTVVIGLMLIALPSSSVNAQQPPRKGCVAVSTIEYNSAKREKLLRNSNGTYVRTGRILRRYYWFCHW
jgi:hypothetical protein